ncbi:MAG TPA: hypothetical protein VMS77_06100 [Conexivisphaerales archaeon]|nr:hypothetical protein [Conexivisphaerales archaeon]
MRRKGLSLLALALTGLVLAFLFVPLISLPPLHARDQLDIGHYQYDIYRVVSPSSWLFSFGGILYHSTVYSVDQTVVPPVHTPFRYILTWNVSEVYQYLSP